MQWPHIILHLQLCPPQIILGKVVSRKAKMDLGLAKNLVLAGNEFGGYMTVMGKTISTDDFYEVSVHCRKPA